MSFEWGNGNVSYECIRCGSPMSTQDLEMRGGQVKCIICGYRVLKKVKPPIVKKVDAV